LFDDMFAAACYTVNGCVLQLA